jgi:hypothetical protein
MLEVWTRVLRYYLVNLSSLSLRKSYLLQAETAPVQIIHLVHTDPFLELNLLLLLRLSLDLLLLLMIFSLILGDSFLFLMEDTLKFLVKIWALSSSIACSHFEESAYLRKWLHLMLTSQHIIIRYSVHDDRVFRLFW